ncbi:MAG: hypothetical protein CL484_09995 [Acidobacteria bacterium]|nr:hypothetical protein [Acidobacteriota bacterium]|tara:strand:+ start:381 stop:668 length:288 start_codon:yes stop_codon:yes gene_type:complete
MKHSPSKAETQLEKVANQILPGLQRELGSVQDSMRECSLRLSRVPDALLQTASREALESVRSNVDLANDNLITLLNLLYSQYPTRELMGNAEAQE